MGRGGDRGRQVWVVWAGCLGFELFPARACALWPFSLVPVADHVWFLAATQASLEVRDRFLRCVGLYGGL